MSFTHWFQEKLHRTCHTDIAELRALVAQLEKRLKYDAQTGLYSKEAFFDHFETNARQGDCLIFLDLDDFKSVNDNYGYDIGDKLLNKIAASIKDAAGEQGYVARLAGDEYLIHVTSQYAPSIDAIAENLRLAVRQADIKLGNLRISRSASMGLTRVRAGMTPQNAVIEANRALISAKQNGKDKLVKSPERTTTLMPRLPSLEEVRLGLQNGEIKYHVQPIFRLKTMQVVGYEALLRWYRRNGEIVGPSQFLNTMTQAYDAHTEPPLKAAYQTAAWAVFQEGKFIAFNISSAFLKKIAQNGLDWVNTIVGDIPLDCIVFELVETIIDREEDDISNVVAALRKQGVRIALDDFGTGQSTFERLQKIPVDLVKIDRSFLHAATESERDASILQGMVDIATASGAETVLEGVETDAHLQLAHMLGASYAQGFHLGEPASTSDWDLRGRETLENNTL